MRVGFQIDEKSAKALVSQGRLRVAIAGSCCSDYIERSDGLGRIFSVGGVSNLQGVRAPTLVGSFQAKSTD